MVLFVLGKSARKEKKMNIKDKYDVIVIGAGIGGLTCGALLAKEGLSVLVADQHSIPGGYCTSFERKGFIFDVGTDLFPGGGSGELIKDTLRALGLDNEIEFIELSPPTRIVGSDYNLPLTPLEDFAKELKVMFPNEAMSIDAFVRDCKACTSELLALADSSLDLLGLGGKLGLIFKFVVKSTKYRKYSSISYQQALNKFFKEPKLKAILGAVLDYDPGWAAASQMLVGFPGAFYYPKGGAQVMADVFSHGVTKHGGDLALKTLVRKIMAENGKATGVELADGKIIRSRYVVSSADGRQTFLNLVGEQHLNPKFVRELKETRLTEPLFLVSLGVDMDLRAMGFDGTTIVYNRSDDIDDLWSSDPEKCSLWIMMHSLRDTSQAPEGMTTVQLMTPFPYDFMGYWKRNADGTRGKEYVELKETLADKLITAVEKIIPQLSQHIVYKDIATPLTFERYTLNSEGASHGWFPTPGAKMRSQKTPIKNLYQAGHWTFPGFSIFSVVVSGKNAAQLVLKEVKRK
jgi:all-trans-retinol 13,14-reductase